jgi:collagenase-like PrtC family protease
VNLKITVPIDTAKETEALIEAGADELYCGVYQPDWFSTAGTPNKRHSLNANLESFEDLKKVTATADKYRTPVYLALNSGYMFAGVLSLVKKDLASALQAGVSGFIVSDALLLKEIRRICPDKKIILSTLSNCFNIETISFFNDLGIGRVVFPRDLSLPELAALCGEIRGRGLNIPLEVFVQNLACRNVNGFQTS